MTHSNTKTIHQMLPSLYFVYQDLRSLVSAFTHYLQDEYSIYY